MPCETLTFTPYLWKVNNWPQQRQTPVFPKQYNYEGDMSSHSYCTSFSFYFADRVFNWSEGNPLILEGLQLGNSNFSCFSLLDIQQSSHKYCWQEILKNRPHKKVGILSERTAGARSQYVNWLVKKKTSMIFSLNN